MLRYVLRPLLVLLTLGALVVALLQVGGRVLFALLDDLEVGVNQLLSAYEVQVDGLAGDWRMLNPIVTAQRVRFPAGEVRGLSLEIDMIGSVRSGRPLARRLRVDDVDVTLEKPRGEPWRLAGSVRPPQFDAWPLLWQSEQLEAAGTLRLHREGQPAAALEGRYVGVNRGGAHRHRLVLHNVPDDCRAECRLTADLQARDGLWPLHRGDLAVAVSARGFELPRALLGVSSLHVADLDLAWQRVGRNSGGRLTLDAEQLELPGEVSLATSLAAVVRGRDEVLRGALHDWQIRREDEVWKLPHVAVVADLHGAALWLPELDLGPAGRFIGPALRGFGPTAEWLEALQVQGRASNLRAHVRFEDAALGYTMRVDGLRVEPFKGVPEVRGASGDLLGFERGLQLNLNAQNLAIAFPDLYTEGWQLPYARGVLQAWYAPDYFGLRGLGLRAEALDTQARGSFALSRPQDREGQRLLLRIDTDRIDVTTAQQFVPYKLPDALRDWLADAPRAGVLRRARLAMQGQLQTLPEELGRRVELIADLNGARARYHPDWPEVSDVDGRLAVAGSEVRVDVTRGQSAGARLSNSQVRVLDNGRLAEVDLTAEIDATEVLELVRTTPLADWLAFVEPDWDARGPLRVSGDLQVPLRPADADALAVRLRTDMDGVDVSLPGYRLELTGLDGSWRYRHPADIDAAGVTGSLFDQPVRIDARSRAQHVQLLLEGRARPEHVWSLLGQADPGVAEGEFDYQAELTLPAGVPGVPTLTVRSSLEGTALNLPAGFGKPDDTSEPVEVRLGFLPEHRQLGFSYRDVSGWLRYAERPLAGAIGFGIPSPVPEPQHTFPTGIVEQPTLTPGRLVLAGRLDGLRLEDLAFVGVNPQDLPLTVVLDDLHIGEILLGDYAVTDLHLAGLLTSAGIQLRVDADQLSGEVGGGGSDAFMVNLETLRLPSGQGTGAALEPSLLLRIPAARVTLDNLMVGDQPFGSWRFAVRRDGQRLFVDDLQATVRGVRLQAEEPMVWDSESGTTRFAGTVAADDLGAVLPQWGYAPSVETRGARLSGTFVWPGSPAAVDLLTLTGTAEVRAEDGRFLDVDSGAGAQRIVSLFNFTAIAKRMALNFSDVFGRGISFDTLSSRFTLDQGLLTFVEPMEVDGTGSRFRISGTVDLGSRRLDNDMIVTLPVTRSLPWYAAYVALANPLAGIGVLVGERVLRKPLEQFSSARYRIGGTLDDPQVGFVSVFDVAPLESGAPEAAEGERPIPDHGLLEDIEKPNSQPVEDSDE